MPRHPPLKHIVAWQQANQYRDDLQTSSLWYQLMPHYSDNLCANFEEAPWRARKTMRYVCLTMSLHWFRLWLGAAYTTHHCLNQWWHKPTMYVCVTWPWSVNTWRQRHNGRHLPDDIFKQIVLNENVWFFIKFSLKSVSDDQINKIPASVQIMAWHRPGDKQ